MFCIVVLCFSLSIVGMGRLISSIRVNVTFGEREERLMTTGMHIAADIFCALCGSLVGWNYETAQEKSQKYKEGKSVLERFKICGPNGSRYWVGHDVHSGGSDADDV
ncbi:protein yippee-like isoform X2 [Primulina eburnea]|uniref:protein yippee-like isoform X2 n=1 Tax=Primulina eburnea TaxID=1245227 RepID=UPI003C6BDCB7